MENRKFSWEALRKYAKENTMSSEFIATHFIEVILRVIIMMNYLGMQYLNSSSSAVKTSLKSVEVLAGQHGRHMSIQFRTTFILFNRCVIFRGH